MADIATRDWRIPSSRSRWTRSAPLSLLVDGDRVGDRPVVAWVALKEPPKHDVLTWTADVPMAVELWR